MPSAPQPFVDLGHGFGLNTGPLGFTARTGTSNQTSEPLIAFNPHFTFHALANNRSLSPGWPLTPKAQYKYQKTDPFYISDWLSILIKSEHVALFTNAGIPSHASDFILAALLDSDSKPTAYFQDLAR